MARKRILNEVTGKFEPYKGPAPKKAIIKSEAEKVAERQELDTLAAKNGFSPENPSVGGLTEADKKAIKTGMSLINLVTLAATRKIDLPTDLATLEDITAHLLGGQEAGGDGLSEEDKEKVRAGISIPEMRNLAKNREMKIPKEHKKAAEIKAYLLGEVVDDSGL